LLTLVYGFKLSSQSLPDLHTHLFAPYKEGDGPSATAAFAARPTSFRHLLQPVLAFRFGAACDRIVERTDGFGDFWSGVLFSRGADWICQRVLDSVSFLSRDGWVWGEVPLGPDAVLLLSDYFSSAASCYGAGYLFIPALPSGAGLARCWRLDRTVQNWRWGAFVLLGLPRFGVALFVFLLEEPPRGRTDSCPL